MRQGLRIIAKHWVSAVLFVVYWLVVTGWSVDQLQTGSGKISEFNIALQILVPVLAGGLIAFRGGWITAGVACGAALSILDFALLLNTYLQRFPPSAPNHPGPVGILVPVAVPGAIGGVIGLAGALAGRFFGAKWEKNQAVMAVQ